MADRPDITRTLLTRDKLATFLNSQELIKAFETIADAATNTLPDAIAETTDDAGSVMAGDMFRRRDPTIPATQLLPSDADRVLTQASFGPRQVNLPTSILIPGDSDRIMETATFAPRHIEIQTRSDDASVILATQIFGG